MGRGLGGWSCVCSILAIVATLGSSPARAQDAGASPGEGEQSPPEAQEAEPSEEELAARAHFTSGRNHFERGRYDLALAEFQASYELTEDPDLLYNIYLAHERLGDLEQAATVLEQYLPYAGASVGALTERLLNIRSRLREQQEAERRRAEEERRRRAEAADSGVSTGAVVGFVAGGVGVVTFAVFAILSEAEDGNLASTCGRDAGRLCTSDDVSQLTTYNLIADIGLAVGLAGAAVGVVFLLASSGSDAEESPVTGWLSPDGGGVAWTDRF